MWSTTAKKVYIVSHDGAHVFVPNLPSLMQEFLPFPLADAKVQLLQIDDGTSENETVTVNQACSVAVQLRAIQETSVVRVAAGLSHSAFCFEFGKLAATLSPKDFVFVVTDDEDIPSVLTAPVPDNLVFISPQSLRDVRIFELNHAEELFHSRFAARYVTPHESAGVRC